MNFLQLRKDHLKIQHDIDLYPYQEEISNRIVNALNQNLRLTSHATEEDIKALKQIEIPIEISRQAGKTTAIVHTVEMIMVFLSEEYKRPVNIGIYAPQIEQARTDFERLKNALRPIKDMMIQDDEEQARVKERENAKTLVLPNGSSCFIAPVTTTSKPESKTFDLLIFEEAQDINDKIMTDVIFPIGASTNAPRAFIGTAGTRLCYFRSLGLENKQAIKIYYEDIVKQRRQTYEDTGDARHLVYEQTINQEIERAGMDEDQIQRPYFGKWLIGTGQFATEEEIDNLVEDRGISYTDTSHECFAGIDTAKHPDSTVVTVIRFNTKTKKKELLSWMELQGENYKNQFDIIVDFISRYKIAGVAIDSTGQGDFMPDMFEELTEWDTEINGLYRIKFSAISKDQMYKNLKVTIKEALTTLPKLGTHNSKKFRQQMLDLQQEYKGQLLRVNHPDNDKAHDDYCDSWALAEWAYAKYTENSGGDISFIDYKKGDESDDNKREITDHWPGLEGGI